ncbi:MAG: histidine phosphatase family protein [Bacteroidetes bacterium]|nr:histidine phosphatase family protein [Bacteroidota bacterium]
MKTLYIMRHAKSSWGEPGMDDFDRPLLEKGKKRTRTIIDYLLKKETKIDLILSSPALRALDTAWIMAHGLSLKEEDVRVEKSIYTSDKDKFYDLFYDLPSGIKSLMIIGHNPAVTNLVNDFLQDKIDPMSTSGIACLEYNVKDWTEIAAANSKLKFLIYPKML